MWILVSIFLLFSTPVHDLHLSKCTMTWVAEEQALDIRLHLWLDDLTLALEKRTSGNCEPAKDEENEPLMNYLKSGLTVSVNGSAVPLTWEGKLVSEDGLALWVDLKVTGIEQLHKIKVGNKLLMDVYDDQKNIVHIKGPKKRQGYLIFEKPGKEEMIVFD